MVSLVLFIRIFFFVKMLPLIPSLNLPFPSQDLMPFSTASESFQRSLPHVAGLNPSQLTSKCVLC